MKFLLEDEKSTQELAQTLAEALGESPRLKRARVVTLSGELGAGKTTFAQAFGLAFGVKRKLLSPTFALRTIYKTKSKKYNTLEHYDWYRIDGVKELRALGWEEAMKDPKRILIVEWPERARRAIPKIHTRVKLAHTKGNGRSVTIQFYGE